MSQRHRNLNGLQLHAPGYAQSGDPGSVGVGQYWFDISNGRYVLKVRNQTNGGWDIVNGALFTNIDPGTEAGAGTLWVDTTFSGSSIFILKVRNQANNAWNLISTGSLSDGTKTVTAAQARDHIDNAAIHRSINDSGIGNTDLWSAANLMNVLNSVAPIGEVIIWPGTGTPGSDFVYCDGSWLVKATYPKLNTAIGNTWGGDGTRLAVPDYRDEFLRGNSGTRAVGTGASDSIKNHTHPISNLLYHYTDINNGSSNQNSDSWNSRATTGATENGGGGTETAPRHKVIAYWIRVSINGRKNW